MLYEVRPCAMPGPKPSATSAAVRNRPASTNRHTACRSVSSRVGAIVGVVDMRVISVVVMAVSPAVLC